jgi:transposase-like protein
MSQACSICNHDKRLEIDREIVRGISISRIAREYDVSWDSVRYHADNHLSRQLIKSQEMKEAAINGNLLNEMEDLLKRSKHILRRAEREGALNTALGAIRETRGTLELMSKIAVTLHQIRAQELEAQRMEDTLKQDTTFHEGIKGLTDAELAMFEALVDKMSGDRNDDVIKSVTREFATNFHAIPEPPKRSRRRMPQAIKVDEEWSEEREQQAIEEENALAQLELEPLGHKPLDLDKLGLFDEPKAGVWGRDSRPMFERAVEPGSVRTSDPQLRRLFDME